MPEYNVKYHTEEAASKYQKKIESERKISGWFETSMVRRSLEKITGNKILDCPCGTGRVDTVLREKFDDILGVDNAQFMLDVYQQNHPERKSQIGSIFELHLRTMHLTGRYVTGFSITSKLMKSE